MVFSFIFRLFISHLRCLDSTLSVTYCEPDFAALSHAQFPTDSHKNRFPAEPLIRPVGIVDFRSISPDLRAWRRPEDGLWVRWI